MAQDFVAGNGAPVIEVRGLSQVERVVDTFVAPSKTFMDILRSASWWLPAVLFVVMGIFVAHAIDSKVGFDRVAQNQMTQTPKQQAKMSDMEPAQRAQIMKFTTMSIKGGAYAFGIGRIVAWLIYALILWAAFNFGLGAQTKFMQVMAVTVYASLPLLIASLITFFVVQFGNDPDAFNLNFPIGTNPAYYLSEAPLMARTALKFLDIFQLWALVLQVIGMAIIAKKSITQSAVVVGGIWVLGLLFAVGSVAMS